LNAETGGESKVSAGGTTEDSDLGGVSSKFFTPVFSDPLKGILQVRKDRLQFGLWSKPVIYGNHHVSRLQQLSAWSNALATAIDQGSAMNPYREGANLLIRGTMSVQLDFQVTDFFVSVGGDGGLWFLGSDEAWVGKKNAKEQPQQGRAAMHGNDF